MGVRPVRLDVGAAVELGELLELVFGWLEHDGDRLAGSFARFVGNGGYNLDGLRADLERFALLLGGDQGEQIIGGDER